MLDAFIVDDFIPRYKQQPSIQEGDALAKAARGAKGASGAALASAAAQRHRMAEHHRMHGDTKHGEASSAEVEFGPQPLAADEIMNFELAQRHTADFLSALKKSGPRGPRAGRLADGQAAATLTTPLFGGQSAPEADVWLEAATRGGPQRRELDWLMTSRAYGYDLNEVADAIKEESEKAESAAGMNEIFRRYSMYS